MSSIAQQGHPATSPVTHGSTIEEIVAQDGLPVGGLNKGSNGMAPAPKEAQEVLLPFPLSVLFACRAVESGIPEHPPVANRQYAEALTAPHVSLDMPGDTRRSSKGATPRQQV